MRVTGTSRGSGSAVPTGWWERRSAWPAPDLEALVEAKGGQVVTVLVPARDEESTVAAVVAAVVDELVPAGLVDEVVVIDGPSSDRTGDVARAAGARVIDLPQRAHGHELIGKGGALWFGQLETEGDLVVLLDADVAPSRASTVTALLAPLLTTPEVAFVKAAFDRPLTVDGVLHRGSGGRVTELLARPVLNALRPELAGFVQPLAGELAVRRSLLERLPFSVGYALEIGMLVDVLDLVGLDAMAQVDIGERVHRHHSDAALGRMASGVLAAALERQGIAHAPGLVQFSRPDATLEPAVHVVAAGTLPPAISLPGHARRAS